MKTKLSHTVWLLIAVACAVLSTILLLSYMATDPTHSFNELGGDGGKNYYNFVYHALYDKGFWYSGMNYPYGEHIVYADGQPLLSTFLQLFQPLDAHTAVGVMNIALCIACALAIVFTYLILSEFKVKPLIAIVCSCMIVMMSPQIERFRSHFGLAYQCAVPGIFYCNLMYHRTRKWRWLVPYLFIGGYVAFMHLYLGAIVIIWTGLYIAGCFIFEGGNFRNRTRAAAPMMVTGALFFAWVKGLIALTDPYHDRPEFPYFENSYLATYHTVLSSPLSPVWQFIKAKWDKNLVLDKGEGFAYIGISTTLLLVSALIVFTISKLRKKKQSGLSPIGFEPIWLFIAVAALLLAMGIPITWNHLWLMYHMSLFKQFRSMGRFNWIFYYVATTYSVVLLNFWFARLQTKHKYVPAYALLGAVLALWAYEVSGYVAYTRGYMAEGRGYSDQFYQTKQEKWPQFLADHHYKCHDFQGMILLPFFLAGSEKLYIGDDPSWTLVPGMEAAIEMKLPIVDVFMSRSSWSIAEKQVETIGGPFTDKSMLRDLKTNKPFLLLCSDQFSLPASQRYLLKASDSIGHYNSVYIYACYPDRIKANDRAVVDSIRRILPYMTHQDTCINCTEPTVDLHFDNVSDRNVFFGTGAQPAIHAADSVIWQQPIRVSADTVPYEFSAWYLLEDWDYHSPYLIIRQADSSGNVIANAYAPTGYATDVHGLWYRCFVDFNMLKATRSIQVFLANDPPPTYFSMDELMLQPIGSLIISKDTKGRVMANNHLLKMDE